MPDPQKPTVTICGNIDGQNDCCDVRIVGVTARHDLSIFRDEVNKAGFVVKKPDRDDGDGVVWTLERTAGELLNEYHMRQLRLAVETAGMMLAV